MAERRRYSDREKAEALAVLDSNGGNLLNASSQTGVPRKTLAEWAAGRHSDDVANLRQEKRGDLAAALEALAWRLIDAAPGKITDATLSQLMTGAGIAIDKMQVLRGLASSIHGTAPLDDERTREAVARLEAWKEARRAGSN